MISEAELRQHCLSRTFGRAQQIASSNKNILTKQVRYRKDETTLSAFVASSHGWDDRYRSAVTLNENQDKISNYSCTCPAYYEYEGMCKHCAALILAYNDKPQTFLGYQENPVPSTSVRILELMQKTKQLAEAEGYGTVDFEVELSYGYSEWSARFKLVGPEGSYVMKSISEFVNRMRATEYFEYGKKLAFTHDAAMLTPRAQTLARFLDRAVELREQASSSSNWRYQTHEAVGREIALSDSEVIELIDILAEEVITITGTDYATRSITHVSVIEEDPHLEVRLDRCEDTGYLIKLIDEFPFVACADRMYLWHDEKLHRCSPAFSRCADFLRAIFESNEDGLFVSMADMPLFAATLLPNIEQTLQIETPPEIELFKPVPCELEFYFDKTKTQVTCEAVARYHETRLPLFDATPHQQQKPASNTPEPLRDEAAEKRAKTLVEQYFPGNFPLDISQDEAIAHLVFGGLLRFKELGEVFTTPAFDRLLTDTKPTISVGISLAGDLINLSVSSEDLPAKELAALLSSYQKRKRFHRLKNGAFLSLAGYDFAQLEHLINDFGISATQLTANTVELPAYRAFYLDENLTDAYKDDSFTTYLDNFKTIDEQSFGVPATLLHTLRPYQVDGYRWMRALCELSMGGILADEMGLGKSIQLITLLLAYKEEAHKIGPTLIVCPASLVYNWMAEFARFAPELRVQAVAGTKTERMRQRNKKNYDVLVTSYDLLRIDAADYAELEFFCCALDEAQYIKNPATKTARAAKRVQARHRFALTGTPLENRLSEIWSIFDFLMPGLLGSAMRFRERFELAITGGDEEAAGRLQTLIGPFMMRRLKSEVLKELPDKLESVVYTQLSPEQDRLYVAHEQQLRESLTAQRKLKGREKVHNENKVEILAELTKLRQICCDPHLLYENYTGHAAKLDTIMELVDSARDAGEKVLVFSQFTSFLAVIAERLRAQGITHYTITGATPKKTRIDLVNAFNADETPVFLVSLKAGGTGLNLTGASVVIHADPWWNAAAQSQATDRAHRIGQTRVVSVYRVIAKDTIEERIVKLQQAKSNLADQVIGGAGISLSSLSKEELIDLLQG